MSEGIGASITRKEDKKFLTGKVDTLTISTEQVKFMLILYVQMLLMQI